jgi:hypothetical protein
MRSFSFVLIVPVLAIVTAMPQEPSAAQPYEEPDAYQIYSLLLPQEESHGFANGTLIIQEETVASAAVVGALMILGYDRRAVEMQPDPARHTRLVLVR